MVEISHSSGLGSGIVYDDKGHIVTNAHVEDTLHNLSDAGTAVPLLLAFRLGRRIPSRRFSYGPGRAEEVAGLFIVVMIAASAVLAAWQAIDHRTPQ